MRPHWEMKRTDAGYHVVFVAANGEPMLTSEVYASGSTAHDAVQTVEDLIVQWHVSGQTLEVTFSDERTVQT